MANGRKSSRKLGPFKRAAKVIFSKFPGIQELAAKDLEPQRKSNATWAGLKDEITQAKNEFASYFGGDTWKTADEIIRLKGKSQFQFYDKMCDSDAVLAGIIETRIDSVARLDWDIIPANDDSRDIEIAETVSQILLNLDNFDEDISELLAACRNGYAISEIVWKDDVVNGKKMIVPDRILSKPPDWFSFDQDRKLYFKVSGMTSGRGEEAPPYKFIHYPFRPQYQNPYGTSLLRSVYWVWWFKHHGFEQWMRAEERGAVGTVIMKYHEGANETDQNELEETAKKLLKSKYAVICASDSAEFPEIKIDPNFGDILIQRCNAEMIYRLLGATLSSGTSESGTRALGEIHQKRLQERNESDSKALAATLNNSIIRWIVELNYPGVIEMPVFKQHYETQKDDTISINKLRAAADLGIPVSIEDAANLLDLPLAEEGVPIIQPPMGMGLGGFAGTPVEEEEEELNPDEGGETKDDTEEGKVSARKVSALSAGTLRKRKVNFRYIKGKISDASYEAGKPTYDAFGDQIDAWMLKHEDLDDVYENIDEFNLDIKKFKSTMHDTILWGLLNGTFAVFDLPKFKRKNSMAVEPDPRIEQLARWKPMRAADAIKHFMEKRILTRKEFELLDSWSRRNALTVARLTEDAIENKIKPALEKALEEGMTIREFQKVVRESVINDLHAENIFRTNVANSFTTGNMEASFTEYGRSAIPAFEFMAVLDDRTTDICMERNGNIYRADEVEGLDIVPPLHFMCRSDLVPVFEDEWDGKAAGAPDSRAMEGFGRWKSILGEAA